eukprot:s5577_g2.t1
MLSLEEEESPCLQPGDLRVFRAVLCPLPLTWLPVNCIPLTVNGYGITLLAGGDNDGDTVMVTLNGGPVAFLKATAAAVDLLDLSPATAAKAKLEEEARP